MFYLDILIYIIYTKVLSMCSHFFWFLWGENVPLFCLVFFDFGREFCLACLICICKLQDWSILENDFWPLYLNQSELLLSSALVFVVIDPDSPSSPTPCPHEPITKDNIIWELAACQSLQVGTVIMPILGSLWKRQFVLGNDLPGLVVMLLLWGQNPY